jgi:hypothetical protein
MLEDACLERDFADELLSAEPFVTRNGSEDAKKTFCAVAYRFGTSSYLVSRVQRVQVVHWEVQGICTNVASRMVGNQVRPGCVR